MLYLLNPRVIAVLIVLAALTASHVFAYRKGSINVRNQWAVATANANADARTLEQQRQRRADEAGRIAATREAVLRADAVRAAGAASGLRDELARINSRNEPGTAETVRTAAISELLGQCSEALGAVSAKADRHVNDIRLLLESWPK